MSNNLGEPPAISRELRWKLVLPLLLPAGVVLFTHVVELAGHKWNVHGDFLGVIGAFLVTLLIGLIVEIMALTKALPALANNPAARTPGNILCVGIGLAFLLFCVGGVVFLVM